MTDDELVEEVARVLVECHQNDRATWNDWLAKFANGSETARVFIESRRLEAKTVIPLIAKRVLREILALSATEYADGMPSLDLKRLLEIYADGHGLSLDQEKVGQV